VALNGALRGRGHETKYFEVVGRDIVSWKAGGANGDGRDCQRVFRNGT